MLECLHRQVGALSEGKATRLRSGHHVGVAVRVHDDGHRSMVLRRSAHHGWASDIDLLDGVIVGSARSNGLREWVEVHDDELEWLDVQLLELIQVILLASIGKDARVHTWVERLDSAFEDLRESRQLFHLDDWHTGGGNLLGGGAGRDDLDTRFVQSLGQVFQAGLVIHTDQRSADGFLLLVVGLGVIRLFSHDC